MKSLLFAALTLLQTTSKMAAEPPPPPPSAGDARIEFDGTYAFEVCDDDCDTDRENTLNGIFVIDESGKGFEGDNDAMRFRMRADAEDSPPQYCYFFDPATSHIEGTTFEYDNPVGFGNIRRPSADRIRLLLLVSSPDFRYITTATRSKEGFSGDWSSDYSGNGGVMHTFPQTHVRAKRIGEADANVCFDAVRKYERRMLWNYCHDFPAETCEPGDKDATHPPDR